MKLYLFHNWDDGVVTAGYTGDCGGLFRYRNPQDEANYASLAKEFGLTPDRMVRVHQSHTDHILIVNNDLGGEGILRNLTEDYDALLTNEEGLILCLVSADCVPVFLYDKVKGVIGLVHSGRVGTMNEIAGKAVAQMKLEYASDPGNIQCILGPYLCAEHHVVKCSDAAPFYERFSSDECSRFMTVEDQQVYVDMGKAITISLIRSGVSPENICDSRICTFERKDLYSWRRDHNPETQILSFVFMERKLR